MPQPRKPKNKGGRTASIWISSEMSDFLKEKPEFNVSKICRIALETAMKNYSDKSEAIEREVIVKDLTEKLKKAELETLKEQNQKMRALLRSICLRSAPFNDLSITDPNQQELTIDNSEITQETTETTQNFLTVEKALTKVENTEKNIEEAEEIPHCTVCNDYADTQCSACKTPLCWTCWSGDVEVGEEAVELCPDCTKKYRHLEFSLEK